MNIEVCARPPAEEDLFPATTGMGFDSTISSPMFIQLDVCSSVPGALATDRIFTDLLRMISDFRIPTQKTDTGISYVNHQLTFSVNGTDFLRVDFSREESYIEFFYGRCMIEPGIVIRPPFNWVEHRDIIYEYMQKCILESRSQILEMK